MKNYAFLLGLTGDAQSLERDFRFCFDCSEYCSIPSASAVRFKLLTISWVLSCLSNKSENMIKSFLSKIVFSVWNIPHGRPRDIYNNLLLNYLHQKQANVWLEQATQIKASMGISREKKDVDDQSKSIHKKLEFMLIKTEKTLNYGHQNAQLLFK